MKTPKTLFIPAKCKSTVNKAKISEISDKLPGKLAIVYSIQFKKIAEDIRDILSKDHKVTHFSQILGCSKPNFPSQTQAVLLISTGKFHALSIAHSMNSPEKSPNHLIPIYILDKNQLIKITEKHLENFRQKQKASYVNFLNSKNTGIIISTKPGQNNLKKALKIRKKLDKKSKDPYLFICNNVNSLEFDNFPDIGSWINTACPRLDMESNTIINIAELSDYLKN